MSAKRTRPHNTSLYGTARRLRREMTPAEKVLWEHLRNRRFAGFKFRRQQPVDCYVVDFFAPAARLVVELDGESHVGNDNHDAKRQAYLEDQGLRVVRFWNTIVYDDPDGTLEVIWELCNNPDLPTTDYTRDATNNPSPLAGEGGPRAPRAGRVRGS